MADEDWDAALDEDTVPAADGGGDDDWDADLGDGDGDADATEDAVVDWAELGSGAGGDAEAMLAAGASEEDKPVASPKQAQDASRAKHIQRQKMRAAEEERARDAAAAAMAEGPLDDPEAEKARIKRLQEERELEIMADTLGMTEEDSEPSAKPAPSPAPSATASGPLMPATIAECVELMPLKGKAWSDVGGMLIQRAEGSRNKLDTGKFIKGVMRAAVTMQVLSAGDVAELRKMLEQAEANLDMAATAKAQGRTKKKKKTKLGRQGQQVGGGKSGYTSVVSDEAMMGMAAAAPAAAPAAAAADEDDDDFM